MLHILHDLKLGVEIIFGIGMTIGAVLASVGTYTVITWAKAEKAKL